MNEFTSLSSWDSVFLSLIVRMGGVIYGTVSSRRPDQIVCYIELSFLAIGESGIILRIGSSLTLFAL
jgi:hypothetical protein